MDARGSGVAGARLRALDSRGTSLSSTSFGSSGRFSIEGLRVGPVRVAGVLEGRHARPVEAHTGATDVTLVLGDPTTLRFVVEGVPPRGAWVSLRETVMEETTDFVDVSDGTGEAQVVADAAYDVWVAAPHLQGEETVLQALVRAVSGRAGEVRLRLEPGGSASGRLLLPAGDLRVRLTLAGDFPYPTFDVDTEAGTWSVRGLPPGRWRVRAIAENDDSSYEGFADVSAGSRADIELGPK